MCSVVSDSLWPHGLLPTRPLCPWDSPGKNSGLDFHFLLQGTFLTQWLNPHLLQPCIAGGFFTKVWATRESQTSPKSLSGPHQAPRLHKVPLGGLWSLDWVTLSCSLGFFEIFWESSFTVLALHRCPSPECVVWVAGGVAPAFLPEGSRESHGMFTPSNDRRPNNKQPKCASGKGWAITENNSWIAVPASCWGGGQPVLAASPRGARPSLHWDIYGGSLVQAGGQSRNQSCQLHHPRDRLQFTKHLWVRLITSIHHRSRRENWGTKSWGKFFPRACSRCALSTYCIPALMPGAENTEAKRISSPHGAPHLPSSGGTWRSQSEHPG